MKGLVILAHGFEDTEAVATIDVLRRAKLEITTAGLADEETVLSQSKILMHPDTTLSKVVLDDYDFLVIPGGGAVFKVLDHSKVVDEVIASFLENGKLVAAICAAPHLLGKSGHLQNKRFTCFPGCDERIKNGIKVDEGVVVDGNIITAKAMFYSVDFGLAIVKYLLGTDAKEQVSRSIRGQI